MALARVKDELCGNCGVDVRPDTQFCYNCGKPVVVRLGMAAQPEPQSATVEKKRPDENESLKDLERALGAEFPPPDEPKSKRDAAAAERRMARRGSRKQVEVKWEAVPEEANRVYYLVGILIFVGVAGLVFFTVFMK